MPPHRKLVIFLFLVLIVAFVGGLYRLMALRFETGDIFPPYSTLRSDPLGTKVLHQALKRLPGFTVQRHFQSAKKLKNLEQSTIFYCGLDPDSMQWWSEDDVKIIKQLLEHGHRLVLTFAPIQNQAKQPTEEEFTDDEKTNEGKEVNSRIEENRKLFFEEWGFRFDYAAIEMDGEIFPSARLATDGLNISLPAAISQHSELFFATPEASWQSIYQQQEQTVVMERSFTDGSLVLMTDSYLLSNEALYKERQSELFLWLLGGNSRVVFDEAHLGVARRSGIMVLVRQYRLAGFLIGSLLLAGLFIWQRLIPFVPGKTNVPTERVEEVGQMDYHAGLVNLLRRNIQTEQLLPTCLSEWRKSLLAGGKGLQPQINRIQELVNTEQTKPTRERNLSATYRRVADILAERKWLWK